MSQFREFLKEAKMEDSEVLEVCKKLLKNGKDEKVKKFAQGLVDFYEKNKSFTPDQVSGLQNIMKNAGFNLAESVEDKNVLIAMKSDFKKLELQSNKLKDKSLKQDLRSNVVHVLRTIDEYLE